MLFRSEASLLAWTTSIGRNGVPFDRRTSITLIASCRKGTALNLGAHSPVCTYCLDGAIERGISTCAGVSDGAGVSTEVGISAEAGVSTEVGEMTSEDNADKIGASTTDEKNSGRCRISILWLERGPRTLDELVDGGGRRTKVREIVIIILQLNRWSDVYARCTHVIYGT